MAKFSAGFLPIQDPLQQLPKKFQALETLAAQLPKLLMTNHLRQEIASLPKLPIKKLKSTLEQERAMMLLSFIGHAYVWGMAAEPPAYLPQALAQPWCEIAEKLGRPPVLSYASYALYNWRRIDPQQSVALGNIALLQNFLGGADEEWFVLIHVDIEAKAAGAMSAVLQGQTAVEKKSMRETLLALQQLSQVLLAICETLDRMPERCDPYIYYHRVRPYLHAWKDHPLLPEGLIYENQYQNQPQKFRGETGAQSTIMPCLDAFLDILHEVDPLRVYLQEMRDYMPPLHREFLENLEQRAAQKSLRQFVIEYREENALREAYNECVRLVTRFRQTHLHYAASYIHKQAQTSETNPNAVGTGGTPFMQYLKKHKEESEKFLID